jgi:UDP-GlcNAc:undecaprenyl-phosphate GlcNAc-1-phosphate transferase
MFQAILLGLVSVLIMAVVSIPLARRTGLMDIPNSAPHKQHSRPTPIAGGIALVLALVLSEWVFGTLGNDNIQATLLAGIPIFVFGLLDDYKSLPPLVKLIGQVLAAVILIRLGVFIRIFESPEFFLRTTPMVDLYLDYALTILWVVGITNAFNFVDSMAGLAVGLGGTAAAFFMLVTLESIQPLLSLHSAMLIGVCLGLYLFNSPPALLFLGDSGAQTLGFILAVLGIAYSPQGANQSSSWFVPILLLGVPIFDTTLVVFSRLRRGRPIYCSSRDHTYHRLLNLGLGPFRSVLVMQLAALGLGCLAAIILTQPPLIANLVFGALLLAGVLVLVFLDWRRAGSEETV